MGPRPAPTPRAPYSIPMPPADPDPIGKTRWPNTVSSSRNPPARPQPALTHINAATCACRRTYRAPSIRSVMPVSCANPFGAGRTSGVESYRVMRIAPADQKNDSALIVKATLRPKTAVTRPPIDAPAASIADHSALDSAFAGSSSSADVTFGIVAVRAGSKNAEAQTVSAITTYAIHT